MNRKWMGTAMAAVMMGTVLAGCGNNEENAASDSAQEITLYYGDDVPSLDVSQATDEYSFNTLYNTMDGLVRLNKDGQAEPAIAESWDISQDGKTYTFKLRDAKWSNGDAVTAHDFEYSWKRTLNPTTASQYAFMLGWIKGATDFNTGKSQNPDDVGVKALDDKTLQVTLDNPTPFFLNQMAFPTYFPLNQKFVEAAGKDYGSKPDKTLSNGPLKVTEWAQGEKVVAEKNGEYWDAANVKLTKATWLVVKDSNATVNMYEAGELDRTALVRDHFDNYKNKTEEFSVQPELTNGYLIFNPKIKGLDNAKIRTALTLAVDRDQYADIVYHNGTVGATGFVPVGTSDSAGGEFRKTAGDLLPKTSAEDAKKLLAEGLAEAGMTAADLKLELLVDDSDVAKKASEFLQEQWRSKLGVQVEVAAVPFKLRLDREKKKDYQIGMTLWGADYNDPMTFLDLFVSTSDFNKVGYANEQYDKLIQEAKAASDVKKRAQLLVDAEKLMMKDMPVGPLFFRGKAYATKPYVKGLISFSFGVTYDLKHVTIEGK